jgi:ferrous iron transport protein B
MSDPQTESTAVFGDNSSAVSSHDRLVVALIGNPNTGKSTLFTALAGIPQRVANYPGVTVEKKIGYTVHENRSWAWIDLPGTYSLAPRSPDEMVAVDVLTGQSHEVDPLSAVVCVVDACNLERNLFLVSQVLEMGLPTVIALTMIDSARKERIKIDVEGLSKHLGIPVVPVHAQRGVGLDALRKALVTAVKRPTAVAPCAFPPVFREETDSLAAALESEGLLLPRYQVERLLLDAGGAIEKRILAGAANRRHHLLEESRGRLRQAGCAAPAVEAVTRYGWVAQVLEGVVSRPLASSLNRTDRIDRILTHKVWGSLLFGGLMLLVFQAIFRWSQIPMDLIDGAVGALGALVEARMADGPLRSLLVNGVIGGIGAVLVFLPQIFTLFFFIGILEDCGYMARAAYLIDRVMVRFGLSGKSFIPLLSSFSCAIPGIMATRVIENRRDRLTTILIAPLMSCSARLPVYTLLIAAFIPPSSYLGGIVSLQALTMMSLYMLGIVTAAVVAWILKRTILRGATPPFVMELPAYKWPSPRLVLSRMFERGWDFIQGAGTIILAVTIVTWAAAYYPHDRAAVEGPLDTERGQLEAHLKAMPPDDPERPKVEARMQAIATHIAGEYTRQSYLGRAGRLLEPAVRPLGWDWRICCAVIASFPAREVVVATLGVIFDLGDSEQPVEAGGRTLQDALRSATWAGTERPLFTIPVALSLLVFFALCAQCAATLAVIQRETKSWHWPLFTFSYMTILAYVAALVAYQLGTILSA